MKRILPHPVLHRIGVANSSNLDSEGEEFKTSPYDMSRPGIGLPLPPAWQRYGVAIVGILMAAFVSHALDPLLHQDSPYFIFIIPVIVAGAFGGLWPGLLATGLSLVVGAYLFVALRGEISFYS